MLAAVGIICEQCLRSGTGSPMRLRVPGRLVCLVVLACCVLPVHECKRRTEMCTARTASGQVAAVCLAPAGVFSASGAWAHSSLLGWCQQPAVPVGLKGRTRCLPLRERRDAPYGDEDKAKELNESHACSARVLPAPHRSSIRVWRLHPASTPCRQAATRSIPSVDRRNKSVSSSRDCSSSPFQPPPPPRSCCRAPSCSDQTSVTSG